MRSICALVRSIMRGRVGRTAAWSYASVILSTFVGVLTARVLLAEGRGFLALILTVASTGALCSALGTNIAVRRLLPKDPSVSRAGYWRTSRRLSGLLVATLVGLYIALISSTGVPTQVNIFLAFCSYGIVLFFSNQSLDLLYALGMPAAATRTNAFGTLVTLIGVAACAVLGAGLFGVVCAYAMGAASNLVVGHLIIRRRAMADSRPALGGRRLVRDGGRLLGMTLGQALASRIDTILLGVMSAPVQVGLYAVAISPAGLLRLPAAALGQVIMYDAASGRADRQRAFRHTGVVWLASVPAALVAFATAHVVIPFVFGNPFQNAVPAFQVLLLAEMCLIPFLVLSRFVAAHGNTLGASAAGLIGVLVLVVAAPLLIPERGAVGAAWASAIAYSAMSLTAAYFAIRSPVN